MDERWFVARGDFKAGPYWMGQLRAMAQSGGLVPEDIVCLVNQAEWIKAADVPGLFYVETDEGNHPIDYSGASDKVTEYAGIGQRFVAAFVDGVLTYIGSGVVLGLVAATITASMNARRLPGGDIETMISIAKFILSLVVAWVYEAMLESSVHQATLGKMLMGIRVTGMSGERISFGRATARHFGKYVSTIVLGAGYVMAAFTQRKQAAHDLIAQTLVVRV